MEMRLLHEREKFSTSELAQRYGVIPQTIARQIRRVGGTVRSQKEAVALKWQNEDWKSKYKAAVSKAQSPAQRANTARAMRRVLGWKKAHPPLPAAEEDRRSHRSIKILDSAWARIKHMSAKRGLPIGEYISRLVLADMEADTTD